MTTYTLRYLSEERTVDAEDWTEAEQAAQRWAAEIYTDAVTEMIDCLLRADADGVRLPLVLRPELEQLKQLAPPPEAGTIDERAKAVVERMRPEAHPVTLARDIEYRPVAEVEVAEGYAIAVSEARS
ncbi:MAG: hypothetical protein OXG41_08045 [Acidimicrobiaceae bacterium]|nr:hypothetical protein [Acidimicrobiaceae bacterium]